MTVVVDLQLMKLSVALMMKIPVRLLRAQVVVPGQFKSWH